MHGSLWPWKHIRLLIKKKENFSTLILLNYSATNDCCPRHYYKTCKSLGFPPLFLDGRSPFLWDFWFFPSFPLVCGDSCMALPFLSGFTFYGSYYQPLIRKLLKICVYNPEFQTDFPECKHQDRESCLFSSVIYVHPLCLAHGRCPLYLWILSPACPWGLWQVDSSWPCWPSPPGILAKRIWPSRGWRVPRNEFLLRNRLWLVPQITKSCWLVLACWHILCNCSQVSSWLCILFP